MGGIANVIDFLSRVFRLPDNKKQAAVVTERLHRLAASLVYKRLAINTCVDIITNVFLACELKTFCDGKEKRGELYYLLNVKPNHSESASTFFKRLLARLLKNNECLVVSLNGQLFIADSFDVDEYVMYENIYKNVVVGTLTLKEQFTASDVLHFKQNDEAIKNVLDDVYDDYAELISVAKKSYKSKNTQRLVIEGDALWGMADADVKMRREFFDNILKDWLDSDGGVKAMPLVSGISLRDAAERSALSGRRADSRDVKGFINDIFGLFASAYHVPISIIQGDKLDVDSEIDSLLMLAVRPLVKIVEDEINAKYFSKNEFLSRNYVKVDMLKAKLLGLSAMANAADKLYAAAVHSVNDNRGMMDMEHIDQPWANAHRVTKNYGKVDEDEGHGATGNPEKA